MVRGHLRDRQCAQATICGLVNVFDALSVVGGAGHLSLNFKVAAKVASGMGSEKKNWRCGPEFGDESSSSWAQAGVSTILLVGGWGTSGDAGFSVLQKLTERVAAARCWLRVWHLLGNARGGVIWQPFANPRRGVSCGRSSLKARDAKNIVSLPALKADGVDDGLRPLGLAGSRRDPCHLAPRP